MTNNNSGNNKNSGTGSNPPPPPPPAYIRKESHIKREIGFTKKGDSQKK